MDCKQIGQYVMVCDNTNWYFDNDSNGMSYFIYKPTDAKYSMVMAPQSCYCGCNNEPNIEFGTNAQVIQSTIDADEAQEWLNSLVNNNFMGMVAVPTYIKQYESIRKYFNAINSSRFTESDLHYLEENMYKAYHITEQSFINYVNYYSEHYEYNPEFANVDRFVEGFRDTIAKFLAGKSGKTGIAATGLLAMLPMIINKLSILFPAIAPYTKLFQTTLCIAKIWAGIKMAQATPKYLNSDKKGRALMVSTAIASQILQCFAVLNGKKFLTNIVNKFSNVIGNLVTKKDTGNVALATAAVAATNTAIADAGVTDASVIEELHNPDISIDEKVELLKDADVPEEKIVTITKAVETETAAEATLKSEATEAVNKANQEQMAAATAEKQQPVESNVNSVEQASTEVASSQPVENANNEQVAVSSQTQEQTTQVTDNNINSTENITTEQDTSAEVASTQAQEQPVENIQQPIASADFQTILDSPEIKQMCQAAATNDPEVQEKLQKVIMSKIRAEQFVIDNKQYVDEYNAAKDLWDNGPQAITSHFNNGKVWSDEEGNSIYDFRQQSKFVNINNSEMKWDSLPSDAKASFISSTTGKPCYTNVVNAIDVAVNNQKYDAEFIKEYKSKLEANKS